MAEHHTISGAIAELLRSRPGLNATAAQRVQWFFRKADVLRRIAAEGGPDAAEAAERARQADAEAFRIDRKPGDAAAAQNVHTGHGSSDMGSTTRRWDGKRETEKDRRLFDLRESGYRGPIDQDGHRVDDVDAWIDQRLHPDY
jgi:hypothetical protein